MSQAILGSPASLCGAKIRGGGSFQPWGDSFMENPHLFKWMAGGSHISGFTPKWDVFLEFQWCLEWDLIRCDIHIECLDI